jgi:hypothetical protein
MDRLNVSNVVILCIVYTFTREEIFYNKSISYRNRNKVYLGIETFYYIKCSIKCVLDSIAAIKIAKGTKYKVMNLEQRTEEKCYKSVQIYE